MYINKMQIGKVYEMEVGGQFANLDSYNKNMAKGLEDKLFFLNKLPLGKYDEWLFVDFGCADGVLISALANILPQYGIKATLVGYDISETMIDIARGKFGHLGDEDVQVYFTYNWQEVEKFLSQDRVRVMVLSSVIHEVYSYAQSEDDITTFWQRVCQSGFDFVCVRDMMPADSINRPTDENLLDTFFEHVEENKPELIRYIEEFERRWGHITNNKNFVHYLLKYRWLVNWKREVNENYFPITDSEFFRNMRGFTCIYRNAFRVPFLEDCWKKDFGISITDNTHIKAIFKSRNI